MNELQCRQKAVDLFTSWLGWSETNGKHKNIIDIYNSQASLPRGYAVKYTDAWCATAVSVIGIELGWSDIIPPECSCGKQIEIFQKLGRWIEDDNYNPNIGDIIYYDWGDSGVGECTGWPEHVGMVTEVSGNAITVIEGNKGEAVAYRAMTVGARYIRGYGVPDYAQKTRDDNTMAYEKFKEFMDRYLTERGELEPSDWATGFVEDAKVRGILDGKRPQSFATREEVTAMLLANE